MIGMKPSLIPCITFSTGSLVSSPYWRITTYIFSPFACALCYYHLKACHTTKLGASSRKAYSPECVEGWFRELRGEGVLGRGRHPTRPRQQEKIRSLSDVPKV